MARGTLGEIFHKIGVYVPHAEMILCEKPSPNGVASLMSENAEHVLEVTRTRHQWKKSEEQASNRFVNHLNTLVLVPRPFTWHAPGGHFPLRPSGGMAARVQEVGSEGFGRPAPSSHGASLGRATRCGALGRTLLSFSQSGLRCFERSCIVHCACVIL